MFYKYIYNYHETIIMNIVSLRALNDNERMNQMRKLFIAEKPNIGRALRTASNGSKK